MNALASSTSMTKSGQDLDEMLATAMPQSQHPVTAWRIIASGEALWTGPEIGPDGRPVSGPRKEVYAERVSRVANERGYTKGFGTTLVYDMLARVKYLDRLDRAILDYLESQPIPRAGLAQMLDGLVRAKASAKDVTRAVDDWLAERGTYAKAEKPMVDADERDIATLRAMLAKRPLDTTRGKSFRARAIELLCAV